MSDVSQLSGFASRHVLFCGVLLADAMSVLPFKYVARYRDQIDQDLRCPAVSTLGYFGCHVEC